STLLNSWSQKLSARSPKTKDKTKSDEIDKDQPPKQDEPKPEDGLSEEEKKILEELKNKEGFDQEPDKEDPKPPEDKEPGFDPPKDDFPSETEPGKEGENKDAGKEGKDKTEGKGPRKEINLPASALLYLSKIKNLNASYQNAYGMTFTRKDTRPPFAFQIGLPHSVAPEFLDATTDDNTLTLSSGLTFSRNLDSVFGYSYSINKRLSNASNQTLSVTFPDVTLSLMDFEKWIGLSRFMSSTRLNSGFQITNRSNGDLNWLRPKQEAITTAFNPLIGFTGTVAKSLSVNLSYAVSNTKNVTDMDSYDIIKTNSTQSVNGTFSYSFRAGRGFKVPFSGKKIHIKNELSSSLTLMYEKNYDETIGREATQVDRDTSRFAFTPGATYQFDQNIKGGVTSSFEITSDKRLDDGTRIFRLGLWVEVNL
ncbi:MAG TPA: hypothetical protein P5533_03530, partial [Candidatus Cloacimonadota bacterium]|nr:hypothetical protein [Candidatus Cloacimonadota bacterium]